MKPKVKEVIIHQEKIEELPKLSHKEVTFSIEPQIQGNIEFKVWLFLLSNEMDNPGTL